jgi:hypothetical protein
MDDAPYEPTNAWTHLVFMAVIIITSQISSNQMGWFPITSNQGNTYVALFYVHDANYIKAIPIKSQAKEELLRAYTEVYNWLATRGFLPCLHKLDNKTSHNAKAFIQAKQVKIQYTPPNMHCTNLAERAVRTWRNHFLSGMTGIPPSFPIANWCCLTAQCNTTLSMMHPCWQNPRLSAHKAMEGSFPFDATPMAPLGTEVVVHLKPNRCRTWGYHVAKAWYLSNARVIMANTVGKRVTDTFRYQHHTLPFPTITETDCIIEVTARLTHAITGVQEATPGELAASQTLRTLLLGKVAPLNPSPKPLPAIVHWTPPVPEMQALAVPDTPILMWDPAVSRAPHTQKTLTPLPRTASPILAIVKDDKFKAPLLPMVLRSPSKQHHIHPPHARPLTRSHLQAQTAYMLHCIILAKLMPTPRTNAITAPKAVGYAFTAHQITLDKLHVHNFISAIINEAKGDILKYRHLVKNHATKARWETSFANELG